MSDVTKSLGETGEVSGGEGRWLMKDKIEAEVRTVRADQRRTGTGDQHKMEDRGQGIRDQQSGEDNGDEGRTWGLESRGLGGGGRSFVGSSRSLDGSSRSLDESRRSLHGAGRHCVEGNRSVLALAGRNLLSLGCPRPAGGSGQVMSNGMKLMLCCAHLELSDDEDEKRLVRKVEYGREAGDDSDMLKWSDDDDDGFTNITGIPHMLAPPSTRHMPSNRAV